MALRRSGVRSSSAPPSARGAPGLLFVTGLSGGGRASALKSLEDIGYEALDNFPLNLVDSLIHAEHDPPLALGVDSRTRGFAPDLLISRAKQEGAALVFLTCDDATLQRRFSETRRQHPMARGLPVPEGIRRERALMEPVRLAADLVIDTSELSIHDLRHILEGHFGDSAGERLSVTVMSFAYRGGLPREADIVLDVRFLRNPYWDKTLRPLSGKDEAVRAHIAQDEAFAPFLESVTRLLEPLLPRYVYEGKSYLTIAFGCSGGRHRSVALAEEIGRWIGLAGYPVSVRHREIGEREDDRQERKAP